MTPRKASRRRRAGGDRMTGRLFRAAIVREVLPEHGAAPDLWNVEVAS